MSAIPTAPMLDEFLSFVLERPTPEQIMAYRVSPDVQNRINELLERNSAGTMTDSERRELDEHIRFDRMMSLLKAKALVAIRNHGSNS